VGVRASTGGRFAPGSANGGTAELGWRCAREGAAGDGYL
jgi:hypothetical protein